MKLTRKNQISSTETIIRLFTEKYNEMVKRGTTYAERKHIANFIASEKEYLQKVQKLPSDITSDELETIYLNY